jgi:hypothetical protein
MRRTDTTMGGEVARLARLEHLGADATSGSFGFAGADACAAVLARELWRHE